MDMEKQVTVVFTGEVVITTTMKDGKLDMQTIYDDVMDEIEHTNIGEITVYDEDDKEIEL